MSQENGIVVTLTGTETGNAMKHGLLMKEVPANHWPYVHDDPALSSEQDRIDQAEGCHERTPVWTVRTPRHRERLEGNTVYQGIRYIAVLAATPTSALAFSAVLIALLGTKSMSSFRTETS